MTNSNSDSHPPYDPLEDCLKNARWPEPTGLQRNRLEAHWDHLVAERRRSRRRLARWTLAASLLLAVTAGWFLLRTGQAPGPPPTPEITQPKLAKKSTPNSQKPTINLSSGQTPTRYERAMFAAAAGRKQNARVPRQAQPLVQTLNQVLQDPNADPTKVCKPLLSHRLAYEQLILAHIGSWKPTEQRAALQILKEIGSSRAIPVLDRLSRDPGFAKHAWPVALHLAPAQQLGQWANAGPLSQRREAIQSLIRRGKDSQALGIYLHLVTQPETRALAIEVLKKEPQPPVDSLFAFLGEGTKEQRHAAGLALGRLGNPEITKRLTLLAEENAFPSEVMMALLNSPDQQAVQFLARAKRNPIARTAVQLARMEWELISYTASFPKPMEIY